MLCWDIDMIDSRDLDLDLRVEDLDMEWDSEDFTRNLA